MDARGGDATAVQAGLDPKSLPLSEVYEEHFGLVWGTLRRYGVDDANMDDAVQDVFLVVHARLEQFEGRSSLRTWLFGIARRVARNHRPSTRAKAENVGVDQLELLPDLTSKSPLATVEEVEQARLLERLLAGLAPTKREAFVLIELEELTILEAAQVLGVNANTVATRLRVARQELAKALARLDAQRDRR